MGSRFLLVSIFIAIASNMMEDVNASQDKPQPTPSPSEILRRLLANYSKSDPPMSAAPTEVKVGAYINSIHSISEQNMDYSVIMYLRQAWKDPRLSFKYFGLNITNIRLPDNSWDKIWIPDIFIRNEKSANFHTVTVDNRLLKLKDDGSVWYVAKVSATLSCPMSLVKFPMDTQNCPLIIESFGYTADTMYFATLSYPIDIDHNLQLPQFSLTDMSVIDCSQNYTTGAYPCLEFRLTFHRDIGYYILLLYIPSILMVMLSWVSFWINSEAAAARMILGLFTILITILISSGARSSLPKVSYVTAVDVWMLICIIFIFLSIIEFAVVNFLRMSEKEQTNDGKEEHALVPNESRKQHIAGMVDKLSRIIFPIAFVLFNIIYWSSYSR